MYPRLRRGKVLTLSLIRSRVLLCGLLAQLGKCSGRDPAKSYGSNLKSKDTYLTYQSGFPPARCLSPPPPSMINTPVSHEGGVVACNQLKASLSDSHLLLFLSEQYLWRRFTILTGESVAAVFHEGFQSVQRACAASCAVGPKKREGSSAVPN